jgi:hypothetical protein
VVFFSSSNAIYPRCFGIGLRRRFRSEDYDLPGYGLSAQLSCHWRWQGLFIAFASFSRSMSQ